MEEYVYIDGKKYRRGYTTGSCATAASKAATYMLLTKKRNKNYKHRYSKRNSIDIRCSKYIFK